MFFSSEVRATEEYAADTREVTPKELDLAQMLIHAQAAAFDPEKYRDTYREKLESIIASRVAGQPVAVAQAPSRTAPIVDITEALQKSLAALKKPAASEEKPRVAAKSTRPPRKKMSHRVG
jgi:DNA end-binding protein Ku